jgi:hypothetical protein
MKRHTLRPRSIHHVAVTALAAIALALCGPAAATVVCIENVGHLKARMDAALNATDDTEIRIKSGEYAFLTGPAGYEREFTGARNITISGGWAGPTDQCTSRPGRPSDTRWSGVAARTVLKLAARNGFDGSVVVENMSFTDGFSDTQAPSCLLVTEVRVIGDPTPIDLTVRIDRVIARYCDSSNGSPAVRLSSAGAILVRNSVFTENITDAAVLSVALDGSGTGFLVNNTLARNISVHPNSPRPGVIAQLTGASTLTFANNLLGENGGVVGPIVDVALNGSSSSAQPAITMYNNRYTNAQVLNAVGEGNIAGDPGFDGESLELARTSAAIDAGKAYPPLVLGNFDIDGYDRVIGAAVDLGAHEYRPLFGDGFED